MLVAPDVPVVMVTLVPLFSASAMSEAKMVESAPGVKELA